MRGNEHGKHSWRLVNAIAIVGGSMQHLTMLVGKQLPRNVAAVDEDESPRVLSGFAHECEILQKHNRLASHCLCA